MKLLTFILLLPFAAFAQTYTGAERVICSNQVISLTTGDSLNCTWYKGSTQVGKSKIYTETPTAPGYYNYQVVESNGSGCTSPISDVFRVYVLPSLTTSISTPITSVCQGGTTVLTANAIAGYSYNYQWMRNGVIIPGATAKTFTVSGENTLGIINYSCSISYQLNTVCTAVPTISISITNWPGKPIILK